jgi:hypothetical protein
MGASVYKVNGTGAAAIATSLTVPTGQTYQLTSVSCAFNVPPVTAEDFTITLNANAGPAYDVLLYTVDPSVTAVTTIYWQPNDVIYLEGGDAIDVAYANSDLATYGVQITAEGV